MKKLSPREANESLLIPKLFPLHWGELPSTPVTPHVQNSGDKPATQLALPQKLKWRGGPSLMALHLHTALGGNEVDKSAGSPSAGSLHQRDPRKDVIQESSWKVWPESVVFPFWAIPAWE